MGIPGGSDSMLCDRYFVPRTICQENMTRQCAGNLIPRDDWQVFHGYVQESDSTLSSSNFNQGQFGI